ncbi:MAG: aminotransferase class IV [Acidimicrobiales bacterium]
MTAGGTDRRRAWLGDRLVDAELAGIALDDHGVTVGDGCFETLKVVDGTPFALTRHLARLGHSCAGLGLVVPDERLLREACAAVVAAGGPDLGRLRITVTGGRAPLGSGRGAGGPTLTVLGGGAGTWEPSTNVALCRWTRNERSAVAGLKTTSYAENVVALAWAAAQGASEALLANSRGELCEGTGSNVFVALDGRLVTPPLSSGCLAGITRELVLELDGVDIEARPLPVAALAEVTEVFLTSSTRDVQPVHAVLVGDAVPPVEDLPAPGPLTAVVIDAFTALQAATFDP